MIDATELQIPSLFRRAKMPLVMSTHYKSTADPRYGLFLESVTRHRDEDLGAEYPLIIVDSSPDDMHEQIKADVQELDSVGVFILRASRGGLWWQNFQGITFAFASGAKAVLRLEPEKCGLMERDSLAAIALELTGNAFVVVGRTPETMATVPYVQQLTEITMGNELARFGLSLDTAAGPRGISLLGYEILKQFDGEIFGDAWEYLWFMLLDAIVRGLGVGYIEIHFPYHPDVARQEEGNPTFDGKRGEQLGLIAPKVRGRALELGLKPKDDAPKWHPEYVPAPALSKAA